MAIKRTPGKFLKGGGAVLILRQTGQVIAHASVLEKTFRVQTTDLGTLTFTIPQIQSIVYKNLPTYPTDVLKTVGGSEINGEVLNDPVAVDAEDLGGKVQIAKAKLLSIVF
jgi:hypothetical protein